MRNVTFMTFFRTVVIFFENRFRVNDLRNIPLPGNFTFSHFFLRDEPIRVDIPLTNIAQLKGSKSYKKDDEYQSIYEFGKETYVRGDLRLRDDINGLVNHFLHSEGYLRIFYYEWNRQYIWENDNGSHHFAVAYYHSINSGEDRLVPVKLTKYSFNSAAYSEYRKHYSIWITHKDNLETIFDLNWKFNLDMTVLDYPLNGSPNRIFVIPSEPKFLSELLRGNQHLFVPFERLFLDSFLNVFS